MTRDEHREQATAFFDADDPALFGGIDEALYTLSELGLWPDSVNSVSREQAMLCWKVVEKLRRAPFPDELMM